MRIVFAITLVVLVANTACMAVAFATWRKRRRRERIAREKYRAWQEAAVAPSIAGAGQKMGEAFARAFNGPDERHLAARRLPVPSARHLAGPEQRRPGWLEGWREARRARRRAAKARRRKPNPQIGDRYAPREK